MALRLKIEEPPMFYFDVIWQRNFSKYLEKIVMFNVVFKFCQAVEMAENKEHFRHPQRIIWEIGENFGFNRLVVSRRLNQSGIFSKNNLWILLRFEEKFFCVNFTLRFS